MGAALLMAGMGGDGGVYRTHLGRGVSVGTMDRDWVLDRLCLSPDRRLDYGLCDQGRETTLAVGWGVARAKPKNVRRERGTSKG
jgi:hypothetical protein